MGPNMSPRATSVVNGSQGVYSTRQYRFVSAHTLCSFTGSAGQAIISKSNAYLITDSRYWLQAEEQTDDGNWFVIRAGEPPDGPKDWIEWLVDRAKDARIGIDARMLPHEKATALNTQLASRNSKLVYPPQNLVDLIWKTKPSRSKDPIYIQPTEFTGMDAEQKIRAIRNWITQQAPAVPSYSKAPPTQAQMHIGTLISALPSIAYVLNLRGSDIPYNPVFQSYLYIGLDRAVLFIESTKVDQGIREYLEALQVDVREYNDIWSFLRKREMGEGKVLINSQTSYAISLMLTHLRYTVVPSFVDEMKALKNETELEGLRHAYARDGAAYVSQAGILH
jgi:Xaa-Pro aminopeptidase